MPAASSAAAEAHAPPFAATVSRCISIAVAAEPIPALPEHTVRALAAVAESPDRRRFVPASVNVASCKMPAYPPAAARHDATGTTRLGFRIDAQGRLIDGEILRSAGTTPFHKLLDSTALLSLMQCGFTPASLDGEAIEGGAWMEYVWRLE